VASPDGIVDLRSDTVTVPTEAMRRAMATAEVGDDEYGEDPTVRRLEEAAADRLGKEAGLFVPSGTMGNQVALRVLARPGTEVLCGARSHIRQYEKAAAAQNAGVQVRGLPDTDGTFSGVDVTEAADAHGYYLPPVSLVMIENTHMPSGGRPWPLERLSDVAAACTDAGLPLHCDGARIFNAAIALRTDPAALAAPADTVTFCLSKGLGAPVGSVLVGPADLMAEARAQRARLGGGMRQAGVIAAAGIVALESMVDRLADDHARARRLAEAVAEIFPGAVDPDQVPTNMVCCDATRMPEGIVEALWSRGIKSGWIDRSTVRFVTHKDIDDADLDKAIAALDELRKMGVAPPPSEPPDLCT
jgi:threonine aldolase